MEIYRLYDLRQIQHAQPHAGLFASGADLSPAKGT